MYIKNAQIQTNRNECIDIIKGIGIILMVLGHCSFPYTHFIYLFHMAIFFIASGYLYNEKNANSFNNLLRFLLRKIKSLWVPYFLWNSIYTILNNFFININIYTNNPLLLNEVQGNNTTLHNYMSVREILISILKEAFFGGWTEMGGALWFLKGLFAVSVMYCAIEYIIMLFNFGKKHIMVLQLIISILFLMLGFLCSVYNITLYGFSGILSFYILYYLGFTFKKKQPFKKINQYLLIIVSFVFLLVLNNFGSINLGSNFYENPLFYLVVSIIGWIMIYGISDIISKIKNISTMLLILGRNTLSIVILHFLCFKLINLIEVIIYHKPFYLIAAYPILYKFGAWWIAYAFIGVLIPVILNTLKINFQKKVSLVFAKYMVKVD